MLPACITVAGSDCSGGAGIQADLKVFSAHSVYGMNAVTAITSQNTVGVNGVFPVPPAVVKKQIEACLTDIECNVLKTGMLFTKEILDVLIDVINNFHIKHVIADPLISTKKGMLLVKPEYVKVFVTKFIPLTELITPNLSEALILLKQLTGETIGVHNASDVELIAKKLVAAGCKSVLIKCNNLWFDDDLKCTSNKDSAVWFVYVYGDAKTSKIIPKKWLAARSAHGTGCTLASAIAANRANGLSLYDAALNAAAYVQAALEKSFQLGHGANSLDHVFAMSHISSMNISFVSYLRHHPSVISHWNVVMTHPFVNQLKEDKLPLNLFQMYLIQKYQMLMSNARSTGQLAFSSSSLTAIEYSAKIIQEIKDNSTSYLDLCERFQLSKSQVTDTALSAPCQAYAEFLIDVSQQYGLLGVEVALLPSILTVSEVCKSIKVTDDFKFRDWVDHYQQYPNFIHPAAITEHLEEQVSRLLPQQSSKLIGVLSESLDHLRSMLDYCLKHPFSP
ncbi:TENA/THI family protein [Schizosaccharomyces japonicus yFS275]|uniref:TENA/THI family protein n=1 Tax=Schizosaccharomyces japonicus (strain yFS275 / FY16936) TaxID=402676 RepID=B6K2F3_SCHJY|nr:TENA/THI family protein [Schizosaccharomyces japonicus yFS275]EEB07334.1 TENA/THI family protein [Schizosaccharomyces japonicus yFS275]